MPVITMSRQIGSGAVDVANRLCQEMGLRVFDKTLMMRVASEVGLLESQIVDYSEDEYKRKGFFDALFRRTRTVAEVSSRVRGTAGPDHYDTFILDEVRAIDLIVAAIHAAYERGNVLIIGRGGQAILEDRPKVLHVRVVANHEDRVRNLVNGEQVTPPQARRIIADHDHATAEYLHNFHHVDVDDPTLYHLVLNASRLGVERSVALIRSAAESVAA